MSLRSAAQNGTKPQNSWISNSMTPQMHVKRGRTTAFKLHRHPSQYRIPSFDTVLAFHHPSSCVMNYCLLELVCPLGRWFSTPLCYTRKLFMMRLVSRLISRSLIVARLSRTFFPRQSAICSLKRLSSLKYACMGTMVIPDRSTCWAHFRDWDLWTSSGRGLLSSCWKYAPAWLCFPMCWMTMWQEH